MVHGSDYIHTYVHLYHVHIYTHIYHDNIKYNMYKIHGKCVCVYLYVYKHFL